MMQHMQQQQQQQSGKAAALFKSHTLRPASSKDKRNLHYQQQMIMAAALAQQQQQQQHHHQQQPAAPLPEMSIVPPGQHIVQPSVYRATSVVDGVNQLGRQPNNGDLLIRRQPSDLMMQQYFAAGQTAAAGLARHESPRSTKSAMAPSSALKLAGKKLAKQQQQYQIHQPQAQRRSGLVQPHDYQSGADFYGLSQDCSNGASSPPPDRRLARHRSRSTGENLHLICADTNGGQQQQQQLQQAASRMLLTTATTGQQPQQLHWSANLPPPDYHSSTPLGPRELARRLTTAAYSDGEQRGTQKHSLLDEDACKLAGRRKQQQQQRPAKERREPADDYYCSRSDCSSIDELGTGQGHSGGQQRQARFIDGQLMARPSVLPSGQAAAAAAAAKQVAVEAQLVRHAQQPTAGGHDWRAIRRRHNEFSSGKGPLGQHSADSMAASNKLQNNGRPDSNNNNNGATDATHESATGASNLVKNVTNKQATPILLSMGHQFDGHPNHNSRIQQQRRNHHHHNHQQQQQLLSGNDNNSKAVQLLDMQRQQLNSVSSDGSATTTSSTSGKELSNSSSPSSAQKQQQQQQSSAGAKPTSFHAPDGSTASNNSTTSGYYAGSNSTGPASVDSDTVDSMSAEARHQKPKVALGVYGRTSTATAPGGRLIIGQPAKAKQQQQAPQQFYLGESKLDQSFEENNNHNSPGELTLSGSSPVDAGNQQADGQWSPLSQLQQHAPSSLKYVSFDV